MMLTALFRQLDLFLAFFKSLLCGGVGFVKTLVARDTLAVVWVGKIGGG